MERSKRRRADDDDERDQLAQSEAKQKRNDESEPDGSSDNEQEDLDCSQQPDFNVPKVNKCFNALSCALKSFLFRLLNVLKSRHESVPKWLQQKIFNFSL